ncbi:MAG: hypothetical protein QNJ97_11035 [Myxococcota bacterium]|nr:hypothetical protein [Myxococcota bacterium]
MNRVIFALGFAIACLQFAQPVMADEIADALEVEGLTFLGDEWSQIFVGPSVDYAKSDPITHNEEAYLGLNHTVSSPAVVAFEWRVSSEPGYDFLVFDLDDNLDPLQNRISGQTDWALKMYDISAGGHYLTWRYQKDGSVSRYDDAGFLNHLIFVEKDVDKSEFIWRYRTKYPAGDYYCSKGTHRAMAVTTWGNPQIELVLQQYYSGRWNTVATTKDTHVYQAVNFFGSNGEYRWRVRETGGGYGNYRVIIQKPSFCY